MVKVRASQSIPSKSLTQSQKFAFKGTPQFSKKPLSFHKPCQLPLFFRRKYRHCSGLGFQRGEVRGGCTCGSPVVSVSRISSTQGSGACFSAWRLPSCWGYPCWGRQDEAKRRSSLEREPAQRKLPATPALCVGGR